MKKQMNVVAAVIVKDEKILCVQRNVNGTLPLKWEFPGGKIDKNETKEESLIREIREELNCTIQIENEIKQTVFEYELGVVHLTTYYCTIKLGEPQLIVHTNCMWLNPEELEGLDWAEADIPTVKKVMENGRGYLRSTFK